LTDKGGMMIDCGALLVRLRAYPSHFHRILPPCPGERIEAVEKELGKLPTSLTAMLTHANGAELFICPDASFTLFGISTNPPLPPFEWAPDWYIDKFTPKWRAAGSNRHDDWAIAMTNYGGLILLDRLETIKEWDTGQSIWLVEGLALSEWIEKVISEGEVIMAETESN
jgi:hypothetical protein